MANQTGSRRRQGIPFYRLDRKLSKYIHDFLSKSEQSLKMAPDINHYETTLNCQLFIQNKERQGCVPPSIHVTTCQSHQNISTICSYFMNLLPDRVIATQHNRENVLSVQPNHHPLLFSPWPLSLTLRSPCGD